MGSKGMKAMAEIEHLSDSFAMRVVKETRRVSFLVVKLVPSLRGLEIGLKARRLSVARR